MSPMTTLVHIDLWDIIFKRHPEVHILAWKKSSPETGAQQQENNISTHKAIGYMSDKVSASLLSHLCAFRQ